MRFEHTIPTTEFFFCDQLPIIPNRAKDLERRRPFKTIVILAVAKKDRAAKWIALEVFNSLGPADPAITEVFGVPEIEFYLLGRRDHQRRAAILPIFVPPLESLTPGELGDIKRNLEAPIIAILGAWHEINIIEPKTITAIRLRRRGE